MITQEDIKTVEEIKKLLDPMVYVGETDIDWSIAHMIETLDKLVSNLKIANVSYCDASPEDIANSYYTAECKCGWWGSSKLLCGGEEIADTGDCGDATCPVCGSNEIEDKD